MASVIVVERCREYGCTFPGWLIDTVYALFALCILLLVWVVVELIRTC